MDGCDVRVTSDWALIVFWCLRLPCFFSNDFWFGKLIVDSMDEFFVFLRLSTFLLEDCDSDVDREGASFDLCSGLFGPSVCTMRSTDFWLTALERVSVRCWLVELAPSVLSILSSGWTACSDFSAIIVDGTAVLLLSIKVTS